MILEWLLLVPRTVSWHNGVYVPSLLLIVVLILPSVIMPPSALDHLSKWGSIKLTKQF